MTFNFGSLVQGIESIFHLAQTAPQQIAATADVALVAATPAIDQIAGDGVGEKVVTDTNALADKITSYLGPKLQIAEEAAETAKTVLALVAAGAAQSTAQAVTGGTVTPAAPAPTDVTSGGTATPAS